MDGSAFGLGAVGLGRGLRHWTDGRGGGVFRQNNISFFVWVYQSTVDRRLNS